jgi:hypothetical protein
MVIDGNDYECGGDYGDGIGIFDVSLKKSGDVH